MQKISPYPEGKCALTREYKEIEVRGTKATLLGLSLKELLKLY